VTISQRNLKEAAIAAYYFSSSQSIRRGLQWWMKISQNIYVVPLILSPASSRVFFSPLLELAIALESMFGFDALYL
jgi:hypothetical protein